MLGIHVNKRFFQKMWKIFASTLGDVRVDLVEKLYIVIENQRKYYNNLIIML